MGEIFYFFHIKNTPHNSFVITADMLKTPLEVPIF